VTQMIRLGRSLMVSFWLLLCILAPNLVKAEALTMISASIEEFVGAKVVASETDMVASLQVSGGDVVLELERLATTVASLSSLALTAEHPATRAVLADVLREVVEEYFGPTSAFTQALETDNMIVRRLTPGVGISQQDAQWGAFLIMLSQKMPDVPKTMAIEVVEYTNAVESFLAEWDRHADLPSKLFLARIDAWTVGLVSAWPDMTLSQRRLGADVLINDPVPPRDVIEAVTGVDDIILWLAGIQLAFTAEERRQHPELIAFLEDGGAAQLMKPLLETEELRTYGPSGQDTLGLSTWSGLRDYNDSLLFDDNTAITHFGLE